MYCKSLAPGIALKSKLIAKLDSFGVTVAFIRTVFLQSDPKGLRCLSSGSGLACVAPFQRFSGYFMTALGDLPRVNLSAEVIS